MEKYICTSWHPKISEVAYTLLEWLKDYHKLEGSGANLECCQIIYKNMTLIPNVM